MFLLSGLVCGQLDYFIVYRKINGIIMNDA